ncbi:hypothetical protein [Shewanella algae]|uniref:hypothetical protein n=1 Tax=Shewanella algae TaxID=38313 RepID=UPI00118219AE|nr:hypothetical protein [Shewanella algae]TVO81217.1 hypothetical protein AYI80_21370 [Shewanella algae]
MKLHELGAEFDNPDLQEQLQLDRGSPLVQEIFQQFNALKGMDSKDPETKAAFEALFNSGLEYLTSVGVVENAKGARFVFQSHLDELPAIKLPS